VVTTTAPSTTSTAMSVSWVHLLPWGLGAAVGVAAMVIFSVLASQSSRRRVRQALQARQDALNDHRSGEAASIQAADAQLTLAKLRVRRHAVRVVDSVVERLDAVHAVFLERRDEAKRALDEMGVSLGVNAEHDDLSALLRAETSVRSTLVPGEVAAAWVARCRVRMEESAWADHLLRSCWPTGGWLDDLPCADANQVLAAARVQVAPLNQGDLFADPAGGRAAGLAVGRFARRVATQLAPGCRPRDPHGDPVLGVRGAEILVIAPLRGRHGLQQPLAQCPVALTTCWSEQMAPRVIFVRTWEGLSLDDIARGASEVGP